MRVFPIFIAPFLAMMSLGVQNAHAWKVTQTCGPAFDEVACNDGETPLPTYWENPCLAFYLNENGTLQMKFSDVRRVVEDSINEWNHPDISSLYMIFGGLTNEDRVGFNPYIHENANIIVFRDQDAWEESSRMMALTTVTHSRTTGLIYDADIEVNTTHFVYGIYEKDGAAVVDLQNTLTHEIGHTFGLAHSDDLEATMFPYSGTGETALRSLSKDDLDAIATVYPPSNKKCIFPKSSYFERPPYEMTEGPANSSDCSGLPRQNQGAWGLWCILGIALCAIKKGRVWRQP